LFKAFKI